MKRALILCILGMVSACATAWAAVPQGYYDAAVGKSGSALQSALAEIIDHTDPGYSALWDIYRTTDCRSDGKVWDMYSNTTDFTFGSDQCGNYSGEGDCYNREHSIPKSWRGGSKYSDAHMVVPTDGYVNNRRGSLPFGEVSTSSYVSDNSFSKVGTCKTSGYSGTVFEPNDEYKGDFARIYFYAATRYCSECGSWSGDGFSGQFPHLDEWTREMMLRWHQLDPVSQKEIDRNDAVYATRQANRNPFVDYPQLVDLIFGSNTSTPFDPDHTAEAFAATKATEIGETSFRANWVKHSRATDYSLSVWSVEGGEGVERTLFDVSFAEGNPSDWSAVGYTNIENGALRLASGSNDGMVVSSALDLTASSSLTVTCAPYKASDNSALYILVDGEEVAQIDCSAGEVTQTIALEPATATSSISFKAVESRRVYLKSAKLVVGEGSAAEVMVEGYPLHVGNVSGHFVEGLEANTEYYYSVTAYDGAEELARSNVQSVVTGTSAIAPNTLPGVYVYGYDRAIYIDNAPYNAQVCCYALDGSLVAVRTIHARRTVVAVDRPGIYIVQVVTRQGSFASRVALY